MLFRKDVIIAVAVAALGSVYASADPLVYNDVDTRANGQSLAVPTPTNDGDGSLRLTTTSSDSTGKVDQLSDL